MKISPTNRQLATLVEVDASSRNTPVLKAPGITGVGLRLTVGSKKQRVVVVVIVAGSRTLITRTNWSRSSKRK